MVKTLNLKVCRVVLGMAFPEILSGIGSMVVGFIVMSTFYATHLETTVGVWCGALMVLHVTAAILVYITRHYWISVIYICVSAACAALVIYGVILSYQYHGKFKEYDNFNENKLCSIKERMCSCTGELAFDGHYAVTECSLYKTGEGLWLVIFILSIINAVFSLIGLLCGIVLCSKMRRIHRFYEPEDKVDNVDFDLDNLSMAKSIESSMRVM